MSEDLENMDQDDYQEDAFQDSKPIEPERKKMGRVGL